MLEANIYWHKINVNEKLPDLGERVLITDNYCVFEAYRGLNSHVAHGWSWFKINQLISAINDTALYWAYFPMTPKQIKEKE